MKYNNDFLLLNYIFLDVVITIYVYPRDRIVSMVCKIIIDVLFKLTFVILLLKKNLFSIQLQVVCANVTSTPIFCYIFYFVIDKTMSVTNYLHAETALIS